MVNGSPHSDSSDLILQFGAGNFLRAFVDRFAQEMNETEQKPPLSVVVVQSTEGERARLLNDSGGRFHVVVRGRKTGRRWNGFKLSTA